MASSKDYLNYVLEQLSGLEGITWQAMMGEFIIRYRGRIIGGVYDDRFLVKPVPSAAALLPDAPYEIPYKGAKTMLQPDVDDRELLTRLIGAMYDELPEPKKR